MLNRTKIISTEISLGTYNEFMNEIFELTEDEYAHYVCFSNVHMIVEAYRNKLFSDIVNHATLVAADGKPLSIFLKIIKKIKQNRICGMDILADLLAQAEQRDKSVFFFGSTPETLYLITKKVYKALPNLNVAGCYSPPFHEFSNEENVRAIRIINEAHPDLILVSLGCPKQEMWMAKQVNSINHGCLLGLGQAFRIYTGQEKRLPKWMRDLSLEWAYRLYQEPKRLWKRYIVSNSIFLALTFKEIILYWFNKIRMTQTR